MLSQAGTNVCSPCLCGTLSEYFSQAAHELSLSWCSLFLCVKKYLVKNCCRFSSLLMTVRTSPQYYFPEHYTGENCNVTCETDNEYADLTVCSCYLLRNVRLKKEKQATSHVSQYLESFCLPEGRRLEALCFRWSLPVYRQTDVIISPLFFSLLRPHISVRSSQMGVLVVLGLMLQIE